MYEYPENCREISGFGGNYEAACRAMVIAGMNWFAEQPEAHGKIDSILTMFDVGRVLPGLQRAMLLAESEPSGAMFAASCSHLFYAVHNGWDAYLKELNRPRKPNKS